MNQIIKGIRASFSRGWLVAIVAAAGLIALSAQNARAQVLYGSLVGNVTDPNGAVIPSAAVTATDQATGVAASTTTNGAGEYNFVNLQPGTYAIKVSVSGFKTFERRDVGVSANNITRTDVTLEVGSIEQQVTITGEAPVLQTDRAETHAEVNTVELQNLPVPLGRNYQQLYRTLPGFSPPVNSHSIPTNPSRSLEFHVNGTSDDQNNTRIDGVSSTTVQLPHIVSYIPALESIQEVNVVTSSFDAEQGLAGGAAINVQIKSGTNQLHGSAFEYNSNNHLKAWPQEIPAGQSEKPKLVYNQFGGTIGGPIKKDKLFYFVSYEGTYDHRAVQRKATVPTDTMKAGDFSEFLPDTVIYNPYTDFTGTTLADPSQRQPFPNNTIPQSLLNTPSAQIAAKILPLWPEPNLPGLKNNYFASGPFYFNRNTIDSKVNWNINEKLNIFGRFSFLHYHDHVPTVFGDQLQGRPIGGSSNPGNGHGETYSSTFGGTYTFTPTFIMDAYFGFTKQGTISEQTGLDKNVGLDVLGIPGTNGARKFEAGWPEFDFNGFDTIGNNTNFMPYYRHDPQYQYVVNFNWTHGKHNVRYGLDTYRQGLNQTQAEWIGGNVYGSQGGFNFGRNVTALCTNADCSSGTGTNRANAFAAFLLGLPDSASKSLQVPDVYHVHGLLYSAYVRDRWNVTPRLTIDYGVRWEYFPFPRRNDRGLERYLLETNQVELCGVGGVSGNCNVELSKKMFSPRLGVAWRITNTFVLRTGYGITTDPYEAMELVRNNFPIMVPFQMAPPPNDFIPVTSLAKGIPQVSPPVIPSNGLMDIPSDVAFEGYPKNVHRGYIQSWNFTLQKQLGWGFTAQAGYVGTRSIRQLAFVNYNVSQVPFSGTSTEPLLQQFGRSAPTVFLQPVGTGHYDSLQASLQRRFTKGWMTNVNYTWGKGQNAVDSSDWTPAIQAQNYLRMNHAPTSFDLAHNVAITNVVELPLGRGKKWLASSGVLTPIVSGWQLNNIFSFFTGPPFNVWGDCDAHWPGNSPTMIDTIGKPKKIGSTSGYWYDPFAFAEVFDPSHNDGTCRPGVLGSSGYNNLRAPGVGNWDFGLFRDFAIKENLHMQFRFESFNFTNTPHFCGPDNYIGDANTIDQTTGRVIDPGSFMTLNNGVCDLAREGIDERQFRVGLRLSW